jgi:hypothetical protein
MKWASHVATYGGEDTGVWRGNLRERDQLEVLGIDRMTILKWNFKKWEGE